MAKRYQEVSILIINFPDCDIVLASGLDTEFGFTEDWFGESEGGFGND